jgi:hypothetical protein
MGTTGLTVVDRRVAYVSSPSLVAVADKLPANVGRSSLVHELIDALGLLGDGGAERVNSERATRSDLVRYHDARYVGKAVSNFDGGLRYIYLYLSLQITYWGGLRRVETSTKDLVWRATARTTTKTTLRDSASPTT